MGARRKKGSIRRETAPSENRLLVFSFRHIDFSNFKFCRSRRNAEFMERLVDALRHLSGMTVDEFFYDGHPHRHVIDFDGTSEKDGFTHIDVDQLGAYEAWQFSLHEHLDDPKQQRNWRVHGILIDNVFHIVWLDPDHLLYPVNEAARRLRDGQGDGGA